MSSSRNRASVGASVRAMSRPLILFPRDVASPATALPGRLGAIRRGLRAGALGSGAGLRDVLTVHDAMDGADANAELFRYGAD